MPSENTLGTYLKDRRGRLDPAAFGLPSHRRRTPGLRREEVAQRANISPTWYTWLEQGRGGAPSADVLDRISDALMLTDLEREHLYLLGLGRSPEVEYRPAEGITPRLQRVLDGMAESPALIRNVAWDVIAWNPAAQIVLADYAAMPQEERNILRMMFCNDQVRAAQANWDSVARHMVAVFRADIARIGAFETVRPFIENLAHLSADFAKMWHDNNVASQAGGIKRLARSGLGDLSLEYSSFIVEGRPDFAMLVFNPLDAPSAERISQMIREWKHNRIKRS